MATIVARVYSILGVGGHLYLEFYGDDGIRMVNGQINGLAYNPETQSVNTVGSNSDLLQIYNNQILSGTQNDTSTSSSNAGVTLFSGTQTEVQNALNAVEDYRQTFNDAEFHYDTLSQIATIEGVTGLTDEQALLTNGNLIVA